MKSLILDLHKQLEEGKVTSQQLIANAKAVANKYAFTNSIITPLFDKASNSFDPIKVLSCIPFSLKDLICTEGIRTTGGSKFLDNYIPPYSATLYKLLTNAGATLVAKDALDEFAMGGTGTFCAYGMVKNPWDATKVPGGSSSGGAVNVATGMVPFAIGSDTGDSTRRPASLVGIVGYKPTYGAISRYGVLPYAPSLDTLGIFTKYVADTTIVANKLFKYDEKDLTSTSKITDVKLENLKVQNKIKFVVIKNLIDKLEPRYQTMFNDLLAKLKAKGHEIVEANIDMDIFDNLDITYKVISYIEAYSSYSSLQGFTFGVDVSNPTDSYEETIFKNRNTGIGKEIKRRWALGSYLSNHDNFNTSSVAARKLRRLSQDEELRILQLGDVILMPTVCGTAPSIENPYSGNSYDDWLMMSNFSGTPSITIPWTKVDNMPYGLTLSADIYQDMKLLNCAYTIEEMLGGDNE